MTFGERIAYQRKQKKWSQDELAQHVGTSARVVSRYENDMIKPSIEVAAKLADALGVTVDYLISGGAASLSKENVKRLEEIEALSPQDKEHILYTIDSLIKVAKLKTL